ncbi:SRPBCC family protein [Lysinibacillus sp. NPDC097287]|uniref:SRPBCC family protein n=1 Tax=Lysinibacillus sp. NPDC097287 TaxID=3364144 RepID=UPI00380F1B56
MFATINKQQDGYLAQFIRSLPYSVEVVWGVLTVNDKLQKWMENLEIVDLRKNGKMKFNMNDGSGSFEILTIVDYVEKEIIEFNWGKDTVRFELSPTAEGSLLVLNESIREITAHTTKDLAGWHVCLELLYDLLNGVLHEEFPMDNWKNSYEQYKLIVENTK